MNSTFSVDFESYSEVNIKDTGLYRYAIDPSTQLLVAVFMSDDDVFVWLPGEPFPEAVLEHIEAGGYFSAYNAAFERTMWREVCCRLYDWPEVSIDHWYCTAAQAAAMALPARLDHVGKFLGLKNLKDNAGHQLMMKLSKPNKDGLKPDISSDELQRLIKYCIGDVQSERELARTIPQLSPDDREVYLLDQLINDRGMLVDVEFAAAAQAYWEEFLDTTLNPECRALTGGINGTQVSAITQWIIDQGVNCVSLNKAYLQSLLDGEQGPIPDTVRQLIELRREAGTTSVKKYKTFVKCASPVDQRVRGTLRYCAARTGRWGGNLIQPQNFPRGIVKIEHIDLARELVVNHDTAIIRSIWGKVGGVVGSLCRSTIRASPGTRIIAGDFNAVEARGVAWVADQGNLLKDFSQTKPVVYESMAARIFGGQPADHGKESLERFLGKTTVLACGYQLGAVGFVRQLKTLYNVTVSEQTAKACVDGYRSSYPDVVRYWYDIERAVKLAIGGSPNRLKRVGFKVHQDWLYIILPSGRRLAYFRPRITQDALGRDRITCLSTDNNGHPYKEDLYGGKLMENIVSGICRDLMASAMPRLEQAGYPVILTVHDEVVTETPTWYGSSEELADIMVDKPTWAAGFPLAAEAWEGDFYRK